MKSELANEALNKHRAKPSIEGSSTFFGPIRSTIVPIMGVVSMIAMVNKVADRDISDRLQP